MDKYAEIKDIIAEYIVLMDRLINFEQNKLQAVQEKNNEQLDIFLKEEQVYLLQLRGLDQKRETTQKKFGMEGLTYRQIIDSSDGTIRNDLESAYSILSSKTIEFKSLMDTIKSYIDVRLHTIDALVGKFGGTPTQRTSVGIYDQVTGQPAESAKHSRFQSTKV